jgi:hypothetical protein
MQSSPPEQHPYARSVLAQTAQVHSYESLRWAAMHADDLGVFLRTLPYVSTRIICQGAVVYKEVPPDPLVKAQHTFHWDVLTCTPFRRELEYIFDPARRKDDTDEVDHRLCVTSAGVPARNVPLSSLHASDQGRRHLWLGMIKAEKKEDGSMHMTTGFFQVDVTDLPSLLHMKEDVLRAQQQQYTAELCQSTSEDGEGACKPSGLRHRKTVES